MNFEHDPDDPRKASPASTMRSPADRIRHIQDLRPDICSLDMGSLNMGDRVFINTPGAPAEPWRSPSSDAGVTPGSSRCSRPDTLLLAKRFIETGATCKLPGMFQICLGIARGASRPRPEAMTYMRNLLPGRISPWFAFGISLHQFPMGGAGGPARRPSPARPRGQSSTSSVAKLAPSNAALVEKAGRIIEELGDFVATPDDARETLALQL